MLLRIYPENPNPKHLQQVVDCLKKGGIIIYPTDTVYAFGCDITYSSAFERIAKLKFIDYKNANFAMICNDISKLSAYTLPIQNRTFKWIKAVTPGPFTFILKANADVPKLFKNNKKKTVGIRIPNHEVALQITEMLGNPMVTTSLLTTTEEDEYLTDPELIYEMYKDKVDIVIDSGIGYNEPSTLIDFTDEENPEVLRKGKGDITLPLW